METGTQKIERMHQIERISGSTGDVLEDDLVGTLKVFVYELTGKYNNKILQKDPRCLITCLLLQRRLVAIESCSRNAIAPPPPQPLMSVELTVAVPPKSNEAKEE